MNRTLPLSAGLLLLACAACNTADERRVADMTVAAANPAGDSILPMPEMIARFQAETPSVSSFGADAATSLDELIRRFVTAVEDSSTAALRAITMNVSEFAYLYFPTSIYTREPYAQPPAVNWLLLEQNSLKGEHRLLREYGGRRLALEGYRCEPEPMVEGANRIRDACRLLVRQGDRLVEMRLFGSVIERDGRFKLMSLANRL